jgi:hypothetical protein
MTDLCETRYEQHITEGQPILILSVYLPYLIGTGIAQCIALEYGVGDRGVRVPAGAGNFSLRHRVQTGSGASYPVGSRGSFPGGKAAGALS